MDGWTQEEINSYLIKLHAYSKFIDRKLGAKNFIFLQEQQDEVKTVKRQKCEKMREVCCKLVPPSQDSFLPLPTVRNYSNTVNTINLIKSGGAVIKVFS